MRQRKLLAGKIELQRVGKRDLERIVLSACPAFEQKFSLLADDEKLGRFARAAGKLDDRIDHPDVKMGEDDRQFLGGKLLSLPGGAGLPGAR